MKQFTIHLATNPLKIETMYYNTKKKKLKICHHLETQVN